MKVSVVVVFLIAASASAQTTVQTKVSIVESFNAPLVNIRNSSTSWFGSAIVGTGGTGMGVVGNSTSNAGVSGGSSSGPGVYGSSVSSTGTWGATTSSAASGVYGENGSSSSGFGVAGRMTAAGNAGIAVFGENGSTNANAIAGFFNAPNGATGLKVVGATAMQGVLTVSGLTTMQNGLTLSAGNVTTSQGILRPPPATVVNVRTQFGAKGTGLPSDNDLPAITAAINSLPVNGGVVLFPEGRYFVNGTIEVNKRGVTLEGTGVGSVIVGGLSTGAVIHFTRDPLGNLPTVNNGRVRHLAVDRSVSPANSTAIGIHLERTDNSIVEDVGVSNSSFGIVVGVIGSSCGVDCNWATILRDIDVRDTAVIASIGIFSSADGRIENAYLVQSSTANGIMLSDNSNGWLIKGAVILGGWNGILMDGNGFARFADSVFIEGQIGGGAAVSFGSSTHFSSLSNSWIGNGAGCQVPPNPASVATMRGVVVASTAFDIRISNNQIDQQCANAILSAGSQVQIIGNRMTSNVFGAATPMDSIEVVGGANITISNNVIASGSDRNSIGITSAASRCITTGNNLSGSAGVGLSDACVTSVAGLNL